MPTIAIDLHTFGHASVTIETDLTGPAPSLWLNVTARPRHVYGYLTPADARALGKLLLTAANAADDHTTTTARRLAATADHANHDEGDRFSADCDRCVNALRADMNQPGRRDTKPPD